MRILFLSNMYPPYDIGGHEQLCREATECLRTRGHDVKILTTRYGVNGDGDDKNDGVFRSLYLEADIDYYRPMDFFFKRPFQERYNIEELKRVIDEFKPDVVMIWGMWLLSQNIPYWLENYLPGRVVYYVASYWPTDMDPHTEYWKLPAKRFVSGQIKRVLRTLAFLILNWERYPPALQFANTLCCSAYLRNNLVDAGKIPSDSEVLYVGIDSDMFPETYLSMTEKSAENLKLLYFGRLIEDKGVHTAVEALGLLKQKGLANRIELTILGSGHPDYEARIRNMVHDLDIAEQVRFVGKVPRDHIPQYLKANDVFLFTSIWPEPFGRTIVEAMLAGLVVIGSDVGGSREIFSHYDSNFLFPPGDANVLADRIQSLLDHPEVMQELRRRGRQLSLDHFTMDRMMDNMEAYLSRFQSSVKEIQTSMPL